MINTNQFEKIFLLFALENPEYLLPTEKGFFSVPEIDLLAGISKAFYKKYKSTPSKEQLWTIVTTKDLTEYCKEPFYNEIFKRDIRDWDIQWIEETAKSWIKWKHLDSSVLDVVEYVQTVKVTPDNVTDLITSVKNIINSRNNITFDEDLGANFFDPSTHIRKEEDIVSTNYDFMDKNMEGYTKGTLNVYVAPPNTGKSLFMCQDAVNYVKAGKNVLIVSLEMGGQKIMKRIGADIFNVKMNEYDEKAKQPNFIKDKLEQFTDLSIIKPGALTVKNYETSNATADDIDNFIGKVSEQTGIDYDIVIIDYLNIMKDVRNPNTESTYIKIKNICEDVRALAQRRHIVIISATQTTRSGFESSNINLSHIAESAGLAATCDTIVAIIQTPDMNLDKYYWLKILKVRDGEGKGFKCKVDIDYQYMRLRETNTVIFDSEESTMN